MQNVLPKICAAICCWRPPHSLCLRTRHWDDLHRQLLTSKLTPLCTDSFINVQASASITPIVLELGGKNAFVVFDDADFDHAVRDALEGAFFNKGEACTASSRLLVQRRIYDKFVDKLAAGVKQIRAGNGLDPKVCMISTTAILLDIECLFEV